VAVTVGLFLPATGAAAAPDGDARSGAVLDRSFGDGGVVKLPSEFGVTPFGAATRSGGVLVSGGSGVRVLSAAGGPGHAFGGDGSLPLSSPTHDEFQVSDMTIDSHGRLLVAGTAVFPKAENPSPWMENGSRAFSPGAVRILRFLPGGGLDPGFGRGGVVETDLGLPAPLDTDGTPLGTRAAVRTTGIAVNGQGQIVVTGSAVVRLGFSCAHDSFAPVGVPAGFVVRLATNGEPDPTFGDDGLFGGHDMGENPLGAEVIDDPVISPSGAITYRSPYADVCQPGLSHLGVGRLTPVGQIAATFGTQSAIFGRFLDLAGERDGSVVALEEVRRRHSKKVRARLTRIAPDGSRDEAFGKRGQSTVTLAPSSGPTLDALAVDSRDRIVIGGTLGAGKGRAILLLRVSARGRWEKKFGPRGMVATRVRDLAESERSTLFFDPRGRLVTLHQSYEEKKGRSGLVVARYLLGSG
jgi:hypothetical protein